MNISGIVQAPTEPNRCNAATCCNAKHPTNRRPDIGITTWARGDGLCHIIGIPGILDQHITIYNYIFI